MVIAPLCLALWFTPKSGVSEKQEEASVVETSLPISSPENSDSAVPSPSAKISTDNEQQNTGTPYMENAENDKKSAYVDIDYVDDAVFESIKGEYDKIDFYGQFDRGNEEEYDFYKEQYLKLLNLQATFYDSDTQKNYYLDEFSEMDFTYPKQGMTYNEKTDTFINWDSYSPSNYIYYFFDMDDDGNPELCISDNERFDYIMKYEPESDKFVLWYEIGPSGVNILGSRKLYNITGDSPPGFGYYLLDKNGGDDCTVWFVLDGYYNASTEQDDIRYMVSLPQYEDTSKNLVLTKAMTDYQDSMHLYSTYYDTPCYRVTEEQFDELTGDYFTAQRLAVENIKKVSYTYDELFGSFSEIESK